MCKSHAITKVDTTVTASPAINFTSHMSHMTDGINFSDSVSQTNVVLLREGELNAFKTEAQSVFNELIREQQLFFSHLNGQKDEF